MLKRLRITSIHFLKYRAIRYIVDWSARQKTPALAVQDLIPVEMDGCQRLLGGCRIPRPGIDEYTWYPPWFTEYIIVISSNVLYQLYLYDVNGYILEPPSLITILEEIVNDSRVHSSDVALTAMTNQNRENWNSTRSRLVGLAAENKKNIELIEKSAFVVVLENSMHSIKEYREYALGKGSDKIWWDKSLNVVVFPSGHVLHVYEHTGFDGMMTGVLGNLAIHEEILGWPDKRRPGAFVNGELNLDLYTLKKCISVKPLRLNWDLDELHLEIKSAMKPEEEIQVANLSTNFDRSILKKHKISGDGFFQSVICWAFYKVEGKYGLCYEPATQAHFYLGRTENIRPLSEAKINFVESAENDTTEFIPYLVSAANDHQARSREAMSGRGCDRHLFALYCLALEKGEQHGFLDYAMSSGMKFPSCTSTCPMAILPSIRKIFTDENARFQCPGGVFKPPSNGKYGVSYFFSGPTKLSFFVIGRQDSNPQRMLDTIQACIEKSIEILNA